MTRPLPVQPLTKESFKPFGQVLEVDGAEARLINAGTCTRFHALASIETRGESPVVVVSLFRAQPAEYPPRLTLVERHPLGSQAFWPLSDVEWLVAVAPDDNGRPGTPQVFRASGRRGVCYAPSVWHHPLIALHQVSDFLVVDREGSGSNLEEFQYPEPFIVESD